MTTLQDRTDSKLTYSRTASNGNEINIYITDTTNWISQDIQKELEAEGIRSSNLAAFHGWYTSLRSAKTAAAAMLRSRSGLGQSIEANSSIMLGHLSNDQWQVVWVAAK
jgi:hypothetical protein